MRLPLRADAVVEFNSTTGAPRTARMLAANFSYSEALQEKAEATDFRWLEGFSAPDLTAYLTK